MIIKQAIDLLTKKEDIPFDTAKKVMEEIMSGAATDAQIASIATALKMKVETVDEICAFASAMRESAVKISVENGSLVDTCGTGGDCKNTFNISTVASFIACGAGVKIAKHGNRSVSSACGSADLLEELGIKIDISPSSVKGCLDEAGMVFLFAPLYHGAMKNAANARKEIGVRTIFNILGPLTNPLGAKRQLLGVYDPSLTEKMALVLKKLGSTRAIVVHGADGLDEVSISGPSEITELNNGHLKRYEFHPRKSGIKLASIDSIKAGTRKDNAKIALEILKGEEGPVLDIALVNAAFAILAADKAGDFGEAIEMARESVRTGAAFKAMDRLKKFTNSCK